MKIYDYKKTMPFLWSLVVCMSFMVWSVNLSAQQVACVGKVNVEVRFDEDCTVEVDASTMVTTGTVSSYTFPAGVLKSVGANGGELSPVDQDVPTVLIFNGNTSYTLMFNECGMFKVSVNEGTQGGCWGYLNVEDKTPPVYDNPCPEGWWDDTAGIGSGEYDFCMTDCYSLPSLVDWFVKDVLDDADDCSGPVILGNITVRVRESYRCLMDTVLYIMRFDDQKGNSSLDTVYFLVRPLTENDFTLPDPIFEGDCSDLVWDAAQGLYTVPVSVSGYAAVYNSHLMEYIEIPFSGPNNTAAVCNFIGKISDHVLPAHGANCKSFKIVRTLKYIDWCTGAIIELQQLIAAKDTTPPTGELKQTKADGIYGTDPWTCEAEVKLHVDADDDCNPTTVRILSLNLMDDGGVSINPNLYGTSISGSGRDITISGLPIGVYWVTAQIIDCADNVGQTDTIHFDVIDKTPPVAIAKEFTVVALVKDPHDHENLVAKVYYNSIDNGSYDHCGDVHLQVRRKDWATHDCPKDPSWTANKANRVGVWADFVGFCCTDVGQSIGVELLVTDESGNTSITWGWVKVEDNTPPQIHLEDIVAYCHDDFEGLDEEDWRDLGGVFAKAGCDAVAVPDAIHWFGTGPTALEIEARNAFIARYDFNPGLFNYECNYGFAYLLWTSETTKGQKARKFQFLEVRYIDNFACASVDWPQELVEVHLSGEGDDCEIDVDELTWIEGPCEIIGWNVETQEFNLQGNANDACRKLINEYTVINWCVYNWFITSVTHVNPDLLLGFTLIENLGQNFGTLNQALKTYRFLNLWYREKGDANPYIVELFTGGGGNGLLNLPFRVSCNGIYLTTPPHNAYFNPNPLGIYKYSQVIKVFDEQGPVVEPQDDGRNYSTINCIVNADVSVTADDGLCGSDVLRYELIWWNHVTHKIDLTRGNNGSVTILSGANPRNSSTGTVSMVIRDLESGCYWLAWKVSDGCGNVTIEPFEICVLDIKAPTPYCVSLSSALMIDGSVQLWAVDFDLGSFDFCPVEGPLYFTFREGGENNPPHLADLNWIHWYERGGSASIVDGEVVGTGGDLVATFRPIAGQTSAQAIAARLAAYDRYLAGEIYMWIPFGRTLQVSINAAGDITALTQLGTADGTGGSAGVVFTCVNDDAIFAAMVPGRVEIQMAVWDAFYNVDWCNVTLDLADNMGACDDGGAGPRARISGTVATEAGKTVAEVKVNLDNLSNPEYKLTFTTSNDGIYAFNSNPMYNNYDISASKLDAADNGVSTLDLVMIQRHILGITPFDSPYKLIAADINSDRALSSTDIIVLRKVILGLYDNFPSNSSWRFVDAGQNLDMENALADFQEVINIQELEFNTDNQNFVAVKIGDVSGAASVNARDIATNVRSANTIGLQLLDRNVKAGELVQLTFSSNDFNQVYGYQFTFELNGLAYQSVSGGVAAMTEDNLGLLSENTITVSYSDVNAINASDNMFTMAVRATKDGSLKNMINITSSALNSEAYVGESLDIANVELSLIGDELGLFELKQNEPNPFKETTVIGFTLADEGFATLTVYDVAGRVVTQLREQYAKGYNTVQLSKSQLGSTGVLYYTLESGQYTATKKMIIIE